MAYYKLRNELSLYLIDWKHLLEPGFHHYNNIKGHVHLF